jgi:hypothetical protein
MPVYGGHGRPPLHIKLQYLEHLKDMAMPFKMELCQSIKKLK